jgi:hypothetical protein
MPSIDVRSSHPRPKVYFHLGDEVYSGDLIFLNGCPVLVVSWRTVEGKRLPYVSFPLQANLLKAINPLRTIYRYAGELFASRAIRMAAKDKASTVTAQSERVR